VFVAAASAWFGRRQANARRPSQVALAARGAGPIVATGVRLALDRRRPALPVRFALLATTVAVIGVVAALSFSASLSRLVDHRVRWGYTWDLLVDDVPSAPQATIGTLRDDPHLAAVALWSTAFTTVNSEGVRAFGLEPVRGSIGFDLLEGRQPIGADEVVIGPNLASRLRVQIGDTVQVAAPGPSPSAASARVVGIALFPDKDEGNFTGSVGFTGVGFALHAADPTGDPEVRTAITLSPSVALADEVHRLDEELPGRVSNSSYPFPPGDVANLASVRAFPGWLAVFLSALGVAVLAHMVVTTIRRRHTELATLRAIGLTPRQLTQCLQWQSVTVALVALAAGLPLGIIGGRLAWHAVTKPIGVATDTSQPVGPEALFVAGLVVVAALLARLFARTLSRRPPAYELRTE
jgi:putative ABC transport system permease protein